MDKKKLSIVIAIIVILILVIVVFAFSNKNNTDNPTLSGDNSQNEQNGNLLDNQEPELPTKIIQGEKTLDNLVFSDIKIVEEGENQNLLVATVKNNGTENVLDNVILNIELFSESGDSIGIVGGILPFVAADSIAEMQVPIALDVMHTNDITISYANS